MSLYLAKLKKLFDRIGTTAAAYATTHPAGKRNGLGKMKNEIANILPEYSSLVASAITDQQITLTWSAVSGATAHTLKKANSVKFHPANILGTVYTGSSTTANATSLIPATKYFFKVEASATNKVGGFKIISATTLGALAAPSALTPSVITSTTLTLTWTAVSGATGYIVERATNSGFSAGLTTVYTGALLTTPVTGLTTATAYWFRVKATASGFNGAYATVTATTS